MSTASKLAGPCWACLGSDNSEGVVLVNFGAVVASGADPRAWWAERGSPSRMTVVLAEQGEVRGCVVWDARRLGNLHRGTKGSWLERLPDGRLAVVGVMEFMDGPHPNDPEQRVFGAGVVGWVN